MVYIQVLEMHIGTIPIANQAILRHSIMFDRAALQNPRPTDCISTTLEAIQFRWKCPSYIFYIFLPSQSNCRHHYHTYPEWCASYSYFPLWLSSYRRHYHLYRIHTRTLSQIRRHGTSSFSSLSFPAHRTPVDDEMSEYCKTCLMCLTIDCVKITCNLRHTK